jgi:hypothetical protein
MSTLNVANIKSSNSITDLSVSSANTTSGSLVAWSNGAGVVINGNYATPDAYFYSNGQVYVPTQILAGTNSGAVTAITGISNTAYGVYGQSDTSYGVYGNSNTFLGVYGFSNTGYGVYGSSPSGTAGVYGLSNTGYGIIASSNTGTALYAQSNTGTALYAQSNTGVVAQFANATTTLARVEANGQFTLGTSSLTANGYSRLPNGLLLQWGVQTASVNSTTTATATFATTFTTLFSVSFTGLEASATTTFKAFANTLSTSTIIWKNDSTTTAASSTIVYMAIGI